MIQKGKAIREPFYSRPDSLQTKTVSHRTPSGLTRNGALPPPVPGGSSTPPSLEYGLKPTRTTSNTSYSRPSPPASTTSFHTASASDYFAPTSGGASRPPSQPPTPYLGVSKRQSSASLASTAASTAASIASKKKPPPPPPKRKPSTQNDMYVVAAYDFAGGEAGDLPFREGDRIKVVKRTESENDWWEGELRGKRGSFPANYCRPA
jgi:amphiphysin